MHIMENIGRINGHSRAVSWAPYVQIVLGFTLEATTSLLRISLIENDRPKW